MELLTRFGLEKSRLTILVMIGLLLMGSLTYLGIPKRENPAIKVRTAIVSAQFPGMAPERVEDLIAVPLERAAREIGEVEDIETHILTGVAVLKLHIYDAVPEEQLVRMFQDIRNKMGDSASDLPQGTLGPSVNTDFGDVGIATIAVMGERFTYAEIFDAADALRNGLYTVDGTTKVSIYGEQEERIWLEIDTRRLAAIGVQLERVLGDLQAQNVIRPAGELNSDGTNITLEANGDLRTIEEIEDVLTKVPGLSGFVRLKDILSVRRGFVDPPEKPVFFNGQPALMISVEMANDKDIQQLGRVLKKRITELESQQPIGISFNISTFQETNVTVAINSALSNVGQTFFMVLGVMLVFLGMRPTLIIASIVTFTVMFALLVMINLGNDIQQVSAAAVIISLGLLVENGLVVIEDIQTKVNRGMPPHDAAIASCGQFFLPLAVASLTTIAAFIPMLILDGTEGQFAYAMGAVVAAMLTGSWLVAQYVLPFLAARLVKPTKQETTKENWIVRRYGGITRALLPWGIPIEARAEGSFRDSLEDLANLSVPTSAGPISLNQVANFRPTLEYAQIRREHQERMITISGRSETLGAAQVETILAPTLAALDLGPDYRIVIGGESEQGAKIMGKLSAGVPFALIVMLVALTFQFNSARRVTLTSMTIPLIVAGAPLAFALVGQPLSFFAILGLLSLMGIIINNAIVLIDQIDIERESHDFDEAIVIAAKKRVTPVMLTSLTTVLGLVPVALGGGALFEPMATLMVGGLLLASPLTLFFVPPAYRLFFRRSAQTRATNHRSEASA
ncbi:efflux RND transporter permease subunit [Primorskyibacter sp. S187A]|uniref:efflux RND transporter permease subunit n=1 Tax=Primorskyibacter sp. S187A TaxID=3415130 RepID=UPI003C7CAC50